MQVRRNDVDAPVAIPHARLADLLDPSLQRGHAFVEPRLSRRLVSDENGFPMMPMCLIAPSTAISSIPASR